MTADERQAGPPTGHADLDTLADLHADVLDGAEAEQVRGHVDGCRQCTAALAALDEVQGELRSLPAPPLPAAVAARLDATLADLRADHHPDAAAPTDGRESIRAASAGASGRTEPDARAGAAGGGIVRSGRSEADELELARMRRGRRLSRALGAVAAAVAVVAAGGAVTAIVRAATTSTSTDAGSAGAGSAASAPIPESSGLAPRTDGGVTDQASPASGGGQAAVPAYDRDTLRAALPRIAAGGPPVFRADPARRRACAGSIPGTTGALRAAQRIDYDGQPAYVYVYADGDRLTGYVVTDTCGDTAGLPATVLDTVS